MVTTNWLWPCVQKLSGVPSKWLFNLWNCPVNCIQKGDSITIQFTGRQEWTSPMWASPMTLSISGIPKLCATLFLQSFSSWSKWFQVQGVFFGPLSYLKLMKIMGNFTDSDRCPTSSTKIIKSDSKSSKSKGMNFTSLGFSRGAFKDML